MYPSEEGMATGFPRLPGGSMALEEVTKLCFRRDVERRNARLLKDPQLSRVERREKEVQRTVSLQWRTINEVAQRSGGLTLNY